MKMTNTFTCENCNKTEELHYNDKLPRNGWIIPFDTFGYDGGFDDNIGVLCGGDESRYLVICHDCVLKVLEVLPRVGEMLGSGCHQHLDDTPCCRHAWRATELFGKYEDGKPVPGVHEQISWPDSQWHDCPITEIPNRL